MNRIPFDRKLNFSGVEIRDRKKTFRNFGKNPSKIFVSMDVYMDENFCGGFSMVKTSNFQKPFLPFDSSVSGDCSLPGYKNFQKLRKKKFTIPYFHPRKKEFLVKRPLSDIFSKFSSTRYENLTFQKGSFFTGVALNMIKTC